MYWDFDPKGIFDALENQLVISKAKLDILSPIFKREGDDEEDEGDEENGMEDDGDDDYSEDDDDKADDDDDDDDDDDGEDDNPPISAKDVQKLFKGRKEWLKLVLPPAEERIPAKEPHFGTFFWIDSIPDSLYTFWASNG